MADNAVKIGLGALITIVGGWITLKLTHCHEIRKDAIAQRLRDIDKKTDRYIDFLSSSQTLMQKYLYESCNPGSEDYTNYMRLHNIVSLTSSLNCESMLLILSPKYRNLSCSESPTNQRLLIPVAMPRETPFLCFRGQ